MRDQILLVDTDSKIPNLALAKIAAFHKDRGDNLTLKQIGFSGYPKPGRPKNIDARGFNRVYVSTIFTHNRDMIDIRGSADVVMGGTGIDLKITLPEEIEAMPMDFGVYPDHGDTGFGFLTRGCIRSCPFCFVPRKEGKLRKCNEVDDIVRPEHKQVKFLDNNFLAYPGHEDFLRELIRKKIKCTFSQGLDIRCLNESNARLLNQLNYWGEYIFAFDDICLQKTIERKLSMLKRLELDWRLKFYLFVSPNFTTLADDVYRIKWCIQNKALPYVMRENTCWETGEKDFYIDIASWCNQPKLFKKMGFRTFLAKRHPNHFLRQEHSAQLFFGNHPAMPDTWEEHAQAYMQPAAVERLAVQMSLFD
ncbi:MAG: radical SAM protein [Desulfobacteraceae bacterium]|nr:radical SAM protein [Desulfobacteraceae bacterium]